MEQPGRTVLLNRLTEHNRTHRQGPHRVSRLRSLDRCRPGYPDSEASQGGVRPAAIACLLCLTLAVIRKRAILKSHGGAHAKLPCSSTLPSQDHRADPAVT